MYCVNTHITYLTVIALNFKWTWLMQIWKRYN